MLKGGHLRFALLIVGAASSILGIPIGPAAAQTPAPQLLPDLQGQRADDLSIDTSGGVKRLRLSTTVANGGAGVLEIYPVSGTNCDGDGNPANDRLAYQRVYRDTDGSGFFNRLMDTDSDSYPAGCMIYHQAHAHWHFEDFARYELRELGTEQVVAATTKVSFCVVDFAPFDPGLPGYVGDDYYDTCDQDDTEGLSVGWEDTYESFLAGQTIDVEGLPDGDYCLAVTGDPSDIVRESNEQNNEAVVRMKLSGDSVTESSASCAATTQPGVTQPVLLNQPAPGARVKKCKRSKKRPRKDGKKKPCKRRAG